MFEKYVVFLDDQDEQSMFQILIKYVCYVRMYPVYRRAGQLWAWLRPWPGDFYLQIIMSKLLELNMLRAQEPQPWV